MYSAFFIFPDRAPALPDLRHEPPALRLLVPQSIVELMSTVVPHTVSWHNMPYDVDIKIGWAALPFHGDQHSGSSDPPGLYILAWTDQLDAAEWQPHTLLG